MNEVQIYEAQQAVIKTSRMNYVMTAPNGAQVELKRDIHFGKYGQANRPCLLKAGAELVANAFGFIRFISQPLVDVVYGLP